ncbi:unnamed protein product [Malus baccata var. baccata]
MTKGKISTNAQTSTLKIASCHRKESVSMVEPVEQLDPISFPHDKQIFTYEGLKPSDDRVDLGKFSTPHGKTYLSHAWRNYISHVGQEFPSGVKEFRQRLMKYAVEKGFRLFYIKSLNNVHTCKARFRDKKSIKMGSKIVASVLVDEIRTNPIVRPINVVRDFKKNYGIAISYYNAWYGIELATMKVHGDDTQSYRQLLWYAEAVLATNPGSHVQLDYNDSSCRFFSNMFFFLNTSGFFPLAFGIVDSENKNIWTWFLENLADILLPQGRTVTFISDHNKGLLEAVSNLMEMSSDRQREAERWTSPICPTMDDEMMKMVEWQIKGFPCAHALAAILKDGGNPYDYSQQISITTISLIYESTKDMCSHILHCLCRKDTFD